MGEDAGKGGEVKGVWKGAGSLVRFADTLLKRFVLSMKDPGAEEVLDFLQWIVHCYNMGSGPTYL